MDSEQRENLRVSLRIQIEILVGQKHYVGYSENVSIAGILVTSENFIPDPTIVGKAGKLWLEIEKEDFVEFQCLIIHASSRGIGARFIHDDAIATESLKQLIYNEI